MTNTYAPHVGGVARSIEHFASRYRELGHRVAVIAPEFDDMDDAGKDVFRVPAVRRFNHTDFSMVLPVPHRLQHVVDDVAPDIVHSHHPFLVGGLALRVAHSQAVPLVFTHHTRYEDYTHNVPGDSPLLKRFVERLATNYANLCDQVFVPSESIAAVLAERGVTTRVDVVPTGVVLESFARADARRGRRSIGLPDDAFVIGHVGRLTKEKNIPFLIRSIIRCLQTAGTVRELHVLVVGSGPLEPTIEAMFVAAGLRSRLHVAGVLGKDALADAYAAMDVFAFASQSETQGMVLTEAMACGVPVVAVDAPGVREVLDDGRNGRLIDREDVTLFAEELRDIALASKDHYQALMDGAYDTAQRSSMAHTAALALSHYERLLQDRPPSRVEEYPGWVAALRTMESDWARLANTARAAIDAFDS